MVPLLRLTKAKREALSVLADYFCLNAKLAAELLGVSERAVQAQPNLPFPRGTVAVARTCLGDHEGAAAAVRAMLGLEPSTSVRGLAAFLGSTNPEIAARYLEGLRRAGVPA